MKTIALVLSLAFLIIGWVLISLVRNGGALKPAGLIKPAEIGSEVVHIGRQISVRLYPDFQEARFVVWRLESGDDRFMKIVEAARVEYQAAAKPVLSDLREMGQDDGCQKNCWYISDLTTPLPESVTKDAKSGEFVEIFVQVFKRDEVVPDACETEKILTLQCVRPISVREVRRKLKTPAPHVFMQRYLKSQFYLFLEAN